MEKNEKDLDNIELRSEKVRNVNTLSYIHRD